MEIKRGDIVVASLEPVSGSEQGGIRPVLIILTLPVTIITLGLFLLVINGFIVLIANHFVRGFSVSGLFTAIIFSILVSLINAVLGMNSSKKSRN